ncbi:hypothetical protein DRN58_06565 [Thermococci archaeon]|nr:MAG: hypothetical protein DRN58_06565 [Thermococci archaeon]
MKNRIVFAFCNNCGKYTDHKRTSPNVIRCIVCRHGRWTPRNEDYGEKYSLYVRGRIRRGTYE